MWKKIKLNLIVWGKNEPVVHINKSRHEIIRRLVAPSEVDRIIKAV